MSEAYLKVLCHHLPGVTEKSHNKPQFRTGDGLPEIRTGYLANTSPKGYPYILQGWPCKSRQSYACM